MTPLNKALGLILASATCTQAATIEFNRDIRPILADNCLACHGPDTGSRKAGLRLDTPAGSGDVIKPGKPMASELIKRINSTEVDEIMPPPESHKKLTKAQKKLLADWIKAGAKWEAHWAFITPKRPSVPQPDGIENWAISPIDHFILAKLAELEMKPNGTADRHTLGRRAALDITGLPPDGKALARFVADRHEDAFKRYVAGLLKSEHAGEHRARYWLDAARYGDTHGMHVDNYREMWPYRDWVVRAFNANMPFDRFIVEQIAGDLLPSPTIDQRIATGFSRCNITTSEGGAIPEELNVRYMVDRVETTATVFLGLTAGCAVCHDHKYDPLSQKEFYSLGAFFNNTTQPPMDGNEKDTPPVVVLPDENLKAEWNQLMARRRQLRHQLDKAPDGNEMSDWWRSRQHMGDHPINADGLILFEPLIEPTADATPLPKDARWEDKHPAGRRGIRFEKTGGLEVKAPALRTDEPLTISLWIKAPDKLISTAVMEQVTNVPFGKDGKQKKPLGWKITTSTQGAVTFQMYDGKGGEISGRLAGEEALTPREWQHLCIRYSGGRSKTAVTVVVNGDNRRLRNSTQSYCDAVDLKEVPLKLGRSLVSGGLSDIRIYRRWLTGDEVQVLADEFRLREAMGSDSAWWKLPLEQKQMLVRYRKNALLPDYRKGSREFAKSQQRRDFIHSRSTTTMVMEERKDAKPRAWVLSRGEYDQRRGEVQPDVPAALIPLAGNLPRNRLGLAKWLVNPKHPLTARVTVNRLWQSVFGTGLVKTSEDFGVMGDPPSHPELLDWLAVEFVESGWNVNHMLSLMLNSATYQQNAKVVANHAKDPDNRYLARGPRLRLDAEVLRDQILDVSGLLVRKMGGPSVKPYQPSGLWNVVAITGSNTRVFKQDSGDALYRRSLYTFWKRTSPPPSMAAFNAPTREQCTVRRERTNTPLQALVLLNDPQYVEAARQLAENTVKAGKNTADRATTMLERVLAKPAAKQDVADIVKLVGRFKNLFGKDVAAARQLIDSGDSQPDTSLDPKELAAWTMAANALMNRDDFINKN